MKKNRGLPLRLQKKLVCAVLEFLGRSGVSEEEIRRSFESAMASSQGWKACKGNCRRDGGYVGNGNVSAELLRLWHRDGRYIDRDARPRALPLTGGRTNLLSIVRRLDPSADAREVLSGMRSIGLIRRVVGGRYVPTSGSVTIDQLHPLAIEHVAKSVVRLVSTVCRNTDPSRRSVPLIERYAYVPDLNRADAMAFAEFSRSQGMAYLEAVDDWLEQRRANRSTATRRPKPTGITAGVHLVAYLGDGVADVDQKASGGKRIPVRYKAGCVPKPQSWRRPNPPPATPA